MSWRSWLPPQLVLFKEARSNTVLLLSLCFFATAEQDLLLETFHFPNPQNLGLASIVNTVWGSIALAYWLLVKPDYSGERPLGVTILAVQNGLVGLILLFEGFVLLLLPIIGIVGVFLGGLGIGLLWLAKKLLEGSETARSIQLVLITISILASPFALLLGASNPIISLFEFWYLRRPHVKDFFYGLPPRQNVVSQPSVIISPGYTKTETAAVRTVVVRGGGFESYSPGEVLLTIEGLRTYFYTYAGVVRAVDGVSFQVRKGETVGLVGESGSGKTVTALSIMRIVPPPGRIVEGRIIFQNRDILQESEEELQKLRGKEIGYIFQDPTSTLDPVYTVGQQLSEVLMRHQKLDRASALTRAVELLRLVEIPDPEVRVNQYPHELSGGTKQRIAIARALSCNPSLLLADEPTTALDVTIQAQILELMKGLKNRFNMSIVLISHDLGIVAETCDRIIIVYAGQVYESGTSAQVLENPKHPYTEALLISVPHLALRKGLLSVIPGNIPNLIDPPSGCRFHPRCKYAQQICIDKVPELEAMEDDHLAACHRAKELKLISPVAS